MGIYAPFLASSRPIAVNYDGEWFFPLFRYLFYSGFYTKKIDLFFNLLIFTFPLFLLACFWQRRRKLLLLSGFLLQFSAFILLSLFPVKDPAADPELNRARQQALREGEHLPSWTFDLRYMNAYARLNRILRYRQRREQHERLMQFQEAYREGALKRWMAQTLQDKRASLLREGITPDELPDKEELEQMVLEETPARILTRRSAMPTLWSRQRRLHKERISRLEKQEDPYSRAQLHYLRDKERWLEEESEKLGPLAMPLLRPFHWEDDAGGEQGLNRYITLWELTRINRKDMVAALIFGVRISLVVGTTAVLLALAIGIPVGAFAGYYGGRFDIVVCRLIEIWESMPLFFMLLLVVAMTQSKSIFLIVTVIGLFGWTSFARYIRGEFFKQRGLSYVEACRALGFGDRTIIFSHILPNAIPPVLTLLPFAVMAAITAEAALSFLGLGEEGSASWGVLMDEGRGAFPGESYLLWPPAILLTLLLVAIALVGDALRDALDPKS